MSVEDAKDVKQLADEAMALYQGSLATYQEVTVHAWERATGARKIDTDEVAKDITAFYGTVARDLGNMAMVWQQLSRIAAPAKPGDKADKDDKDDKGGKRR